ncbi:hypothetical protein JK168_11625 [Acetobacter thailandicus]|nr:hypothetical protein [Acetobacter thailandicus]
MLLADLPAETEEIIGDRGYDSNKILNISTGSDGVASPCSHLNRSESSPDQGRTPQNPQSGKMLRANHQARSIKQIPPTWRDLFQKSTLTDILLIHQFCYPFHFTDSRQKIIPVWPEQ